MSLDEDLDEEVRKLPERHFRKKWAKEAFPESKLSRLVRGLYLRGPIWKRVCAGLITAYLTLNIPPALSWIAWGKRYMKEPIHARVIGSDPDETLFVRPYCPKDSTNEISYFYHYEKRLKIKVLRPDYISEKEAVYPAANDKILFPAGDVKKYHSGIIWPFGVLWPVEGEVRGKTERETYIKEKEWEEGVYKRDGIYKRADRIKLLKDAKQTSLGD